MPKKPRTFDATVTKQGRVAIPKEIRERLGVRAGGKVRFTLEDRNRIVITPADLSFQRLFGLLGKPPRSATLKQMDEAIRRAAVDRYLRAVGGKRR